MLDWTKKYTWLWAPDDIDGTGTEQYCTIECLPEGWLMAFGEIMCQEIDEEVKRSKLDDLYVVQAKEKFGKMVIFFNHNTPALVDILRKYEQISAHVCAYCGEPDIGMVSLCGWLEPYCQNCYEKHLRRGGKPYNDILVGEAKMPDKIYWHRFSQHMQEDFEMDISETTQKIRAQYEQRKDNGQFKDDNFDEWEDSYYGA